MNGHAQYNRNHSSLFLIELIIAILFFSLASAICIQLFTRTKLIGQESREITESVLLAQSAAESFETCTNSIAPMIPFYQDSLDDDVKNSSTTDIDIPDNYFVAYYDTAFQPCEKEHATYQLQVTAAFANHLACATITVSTNTATTKEIYTLDVKHAY